MILSFTPSVPLSPPSSVWMSYFLHLCQTICDSKENNHFPFHMWVWLWITVLPCLTLQVTEWFPFAPCCGQSYQLLFIAILCALVCGSYPETLISWLDSFCLTSQLSWTMHSKQFNVDVSVSLAMYAAVGCSAIGKFWQSAQASLLHFLSALALLATGWWLFLLEGRDFFLCFWPMLSGN